MVDQREYRRKLLLAAHKKSRGDINRNLSVSDVMPGVASDDEDAEIIVSPLSELGWLKLPELCDPFVVFQITMDGIEEAERMERSLYRRISDEHPFVYDCTKAVAIALLTALALWVFGFRK